MTDRPNILFILADQHNAKVMGHRGHPDVQTPHFDRLAAEGVWFDNAIAQNPICTPSRVSWFSGQYCHNHGYYGLSGPNPRGLPTVLGHFRRAGYRTAAVGKIHCPEHWIEMDADLFHETCGCSVGGRSKQYADYLAARELTHLEDHGALQEFGPRGRQTVDARPSKVCYADSQEGWIARTIVDYMGRYKAEGKPFIVHASLPKPHQCYAPAQEFWDLYDESALTLPPNADYDMAHKAPHLRRQAEHWRTARWQLFHPKTFAAGRLRKLHGYLGCVSHVDHAVGQMLDGLRTHGLADDTIVVYASDHGDYACEHGIMEKAPGICSDAITRVPMLWRWPGHVAAGHVATEIVETVDFANTLCALTGVDALETADGKDISHLLRGESGDAHRLGVTEFAWSRSVRKGRHRLVYYPPEMFADECPDGFGELYDLEADPWEMHNLYFDPAHADLVRQLERDLLDWLVTTTRPVTVLPLRPYASPQSVTRYGATVNGDNKTHHDRIRALKHRNYV